MDDAVGIRRFPVEGGFRRAAWPAILRRLFASRESEARLLKAKGSYYPLHNRLTPLDCTRKRLLACQRLRVSTALDSYLLILGFGSEIPSGGRVCQRLFIPLMGRPGRLPLTVPKPAIRITLSPIACSIRARSPSILPVSASQ
jgi:hypothetical protein